MAKAMCHISPSPVDPVMGKGRFPLAAWLPAAFFIHIYVYIYIYIFCVLVYIYICIYMCKYNIYIYMDVGQNCVWNVPRCSGRMERRGFVTGLVLDLWSVMKYNLYLIIYRYMYTVYIWNVYNMNLKDMHVEATHAGCRSFSLLICTTSLLYTCSSQVCLAWLLLVH